MSALVATFSHPLQGFAGFFRAIDGFLTSVRRAQEFDALYSMSDEELKARGFTRDGLVNTFFGI